MKRLFRFKKKEDETHVEHNRGCVGVKIATEWAGNEEKMPDI